MFLYAKVDIEIVLYSARCTLGEYGMKTKRRLLYVALGAVLALTLVFGGFAVFAQTDGEADADGAVPDTENGEGAPFPWQGRPGFGNVRPDRLHHGRPEFFHGERPELTSGEELLAEALGVSVEDLQAARDEARLAAIDQAEANGLLTEAQAERLRSAPAGFLGRLGRSFPGLLEGIEDHESLLADALGISEETLQAAKEQAQDARLAEMVEAGLMTQEQLDKLQANQAVRQYLDVDGIKEAIQEAFESAVEQALAAGDISQAQADEMLENIENLNLSRFGGRAPGGPGSGGHGPGKPGMGRPGFGGRGFGHQGGFAPFQQAPGGSGA
jgi:hypothetical protein